MKKNNTVWNPSEPFSLLKWSEAAEVYALMTRISIDEALTTLPDLYDNLSRAELINTIELKARDYYLSMHKDAIFQGGDGRYKTHIVIDDKRVLLAKTKKRDLENILINHYKALDTVHSFESMWEEFTVWRKKYVRITTLDRDQTSFATFLEEEEISSCDIRNITQKQLNDFCLKKVLELRLDKKSWQRLKSLLNAIYDFAVETGYADVHLARTIKPFGAAWWTPSGKLDLQEVREKYPEMISEDELSKSMKEEEGPQVYTVAEEDALIRACIASYQNTDNTAYLAIAMSFFLGLRIGELVALQVSDFDLKAGILHVRRREITSKDESGKRTFRISERLKNEASHRDIPITGNCRILFEMILESNRKNGWADEWLFHCVTSGDRMRSSSVDAALDRANTDAKLEQRSLHKVRKTLLSRLHQSMHFSDERIRELAGHSRGSMTMYTHYFYHIEDGAGLDTCDTFEKVAEYGIPDIKQILRINQPLIFRRAV